MGAKKQRLEELLFEAVRQEKYLASRNLWMNSDVTEAMSYPDLKKVDKLDDVDYIRLYVWDFSTQTWS